jgi:hypothetical protein
MSMDNPIEFHVEYCTGMRIVSIPNCTRGLHISGGSENRLFYRNQIASLRLACIALV